MPSRSAELTPENDARNAVRVSHTSSIRRHMLRAASATRRGRRIALYSSMAREACEIVCMNEAAPLRWRWRYTEASGAVELSRDEFELFFECVTAARGEGYEPRFAGRRIVIVCGAAARHSK